MRDATPPTPGGVAVVPHTVGLVPLTDDGIDRLTRALCEVDEHVHPPELVWWVATTGPAAAGVQPSVERGALWGYRGSNGGREALVTAWGHDDGGAHADLVVWVSERLTTPRRE